MTLTRQTWAVPGFAENIALLCQSIRTALPTELEATLGDRIELALAEILNNVVVHGYGGGADAIMQVQMQALGGRVEITVSDRGTAFNPAGPAELPDIDPSNVADLPEGGFGLGIVARCADEIRFSRIGPDNLTTMVFTRGAA